MTELTPIDENNLKTSYIKFSSNYQFNVILIYILSLEVIIKLTSNILEKNLKSEQLQNILIKAINSYLDVISFYKNNYLKFNLDNINLNIPSDYIDSVNNKISLVNSKNINSFSFNLLISGIIINYNSEDKANLFKNNNNFVNNKRKYSTLISHNNILKRNFSTSSRKLINNEQIKNNYNLNYNKSIFSILDKIKELTKENYQINIYRTIQDLQPHIYKVFILNDPSSLKRAFPYLYIFLDDIRIYLITYNVITTYFRRSSRNTICNFVADQVLFFIFKTYFLPIILNESKGSSSINKKLTNLKKSELI